MFNRRRDDMSPVTNSRFTQTANREVVRFSPTRRENNLILLRTNERRDLASRPIDCGTRLLSEPVHARRIAEILDDRARHRRRDTRVDRRGGAVIQVNSAY
jgi:hypothetical protein